jgi:ubiquitin-protein ligase
MLQARMMKEIAILTKEPPPGISAWPREGKITEIDASKSDPHMNDQLDLY